MGRKIIRSGLSAVPESGAPDSGTSASKVIEQPVHDAQKRAREVLQEAHRRANQIVQQAEEKAEARLEQVEEQIRERSSEQIEDAARARESARAEGHDEGFARWQQLLMEVHSSRQELLEELRGQIVHLALEIGAKLHRSRLEIEPAEIVPLVRDSLAALGGVRGEIEVHVHPEDAAAIETSRADLVGQDPRWSTLIVVQDESIGRGGCRVASALGSVDATVEGQLRAIEEHLLHDDGRSPTE